MKVYFSHGKESGPWGSLQLNTYSAVINKKISMLKEAYLKQPLFQPNLDARLTTISTVWPNWAS
jgi:hypothetical protein